MMAKTHTRTLPVRLTQAELLERGKALALVRQDCNHIESDMKLTVRAFKDRIEIREAEIDRLAEIVDLEAEPRPVECRNVRDMNRGVIEVVRTDTGEIVESRVMTELERQTRMFEPEEEQAQEATGGAA
jgi:hypothetical protein